MKMQTVEIDNKELVLMTREAFDELMEKAGVLPPLPAKSARGGYPARETAMAVIAREVVTRRIRAGWTQRELAKKAGLRAEQISRLESGKHRPTNETITRIEAAFHGAE